MMYKLAKKGKRKLLNSDYFSCNWECKDPNCEGRMSSRRIDVDIPVDIDVKVLPTRSNNELYHSLHCSISEEYIIHQLIKQEIIERSKLPDVVYTEVYNEVLLDFQIDYPNYVDSFPFSQYNLSSTQSRANIVRIHLQITDTTQIKEKYGIIHLNI